MYKISALCSLEFKDWIAEIDGALCTKPSDSVIFRKLAWQASNDKNRSFGSPARMRKSEANRSPIPRSDAEIENMQQLLKMIGESPMCSLLRCEIFRELGEFKWAHKQLEKNLPDDCLDFCAYINGLVDARNSAVFLLPNYLRQSARRILLSN